MVGAGAGVGASRLFVEISFLQKVENDLFADVKSLTSGIISECALLLHLLILLSVKNQHSCQQDARSVSLLAK